VLNTDNRKKSRKLKAIADRLGCSRSQLALAWACAQEGVSSVITGASLVDQLEENLDALKIEITEELQSELDQLFPVAKPGHAE